LSDAVVLGVEGELEDISSSSLGVVRAEVQTTVPDGDRDGVAS